MKLKKILASILCVAMVLSTISVFAVGDSNETDAEAMFNGEYYSTVALALADATASTDEEVEITVLKNVTSLPAPTRGGLTFKAAEGVKVTSRVNPPRFNPVDGVVKYVGFDFTTYDTGNGLFAAFDGGHELAGLEVVFENCKFGGQKSIGFSWGVNSNMEKLTIDNCTIDVVDASQYFVLGYIDNVEIKNCDFSNHTGGKSIVQCSTTSNNVTITNTNFGNGYINYAPNVGETEKTLVVEECTFTGTRAINLHSNFTNYGSFASLTLTDNVFGGTTSVLTFPAGVESNEFLDDAELTFEGNKTVNGDEVTNLTVPVDAVAEVNGIYYAEIQEALNKVKTTTGNKITLVDNVSVSGQNALDALTGDTLDLNGYTLTVNGNSYFSDGTTTFTNGDIVVTGYASDSYFCGYTAGAVIVFDDVTITGDNYTTGCALFNANQGKIELINSEITVSGDTTGGVIYGGDTTIEGTTINATNVCRGITNSVTEIKENSNFVFDGGERGFNNSTVTVDASTVTIKNATKSAVRLNNNTLTLNNNALLTTENCAEDVVLYSSESKAVVICDTTSTFDADFAAVAKIGDSSFASIQAAVNAAVAGDNEIVILPGTYDESFMVNQAPGKNITITAENKGDVTLTGTISVNGNRSQNGAETLTISNLVFDGSNKTAAHNFIIDSNGTPNYPTYAHNVTVKNCDFIGNDDMAAPVVAFREAKGGSNNIVFDGVTATDIHSLMQVSSSLKLTVKNSTLTNLGEGAVNATGTSEVIFTNNVVDAAIYAVRTGQNNSSTNTVANITMTGNTISSDVTALAMRNATTTAVMTNNSIVAPSAFTADNADASTINGVAITADEIDAAVNDNNEVIPESMSIGFVQVEPGLYNIVITATDDIYEFVGAELTFANTSKTVAGEDMNYEILGISGTTNAEKSIEKADTYALRLVDGAERMSGKDLVIGQVKFHGQGDINFTVSEGKVVTTEYGTNLGQYYTLDADDTTADTLTVNAITNDAVEEVTRDVVVNVAYKHALDGTYWNDNKITVTLKDGFGNIYGPFDVSDEIETIPDVKLGRLTVTLEAPGFRKYVYNTTLEAGADENDALVLNFWNDIKRNTVQSPLAEIEAGVSGETNKNFVVGDIVMDYTVDEYDLAAVTSYYGMYELEDADKYIKYDLNRDGNIDIIDVHYVLHTLNN